MKGVIYARVSTDIQDFNRQIEDIKKYCNKENIEIVKEFSEKESGTIRERKLLNEMMEYLKDTNDIDCVVISELSRLGRTSKVLETIETLNKQEINLIALKEKIETLDKDKNVHISATLIIPILSSINQYELTTMKYRSKSGIRNSIKKGNANGTYNIPYGYKKLNNKKLVRDEDEAKIIKDIFNLYLEGNGTKKIAKILNEKKIKTRTEKIIDAGFNKGKSYTGYKQKWVDGTIYFILNNSLYTGKRKHKIGKKLVEGKLNKKGEQLYRNVYEYFDQEQLRIIDDKTFNDVQKLLKSHNNKREKHQKFNYLLDNGKIICGVCGRTYYAHKRANGKDNTYKCLSRRYNESCDNAGISIDKIERLVQSVILHSYSNILIKNLRDNNLKGEIDTLKNEINELNEELRKEQTKEGNLVDLLLDDKISKETYNKKYEVSKTNQDNIKNRIKLLDDKLTTSEKSYNNMTNLNKIKKEFNRQNVKLPSSIVNSILTKLELTKIDKAPEKFRELVSIIPNYTDKFNHKKDVLILAKLVFGLSEEYYLISQRTHFVFDFQDTSLKLPFEVGFDGWKMLLPMKRI